MFRPAHILVATDLSRESDRALSAAFDIAGKFKSSIEVLYVLDDIIECTADYCMPHERAEATRANMLKQAKKQMKEQVTRIAKDPKISLRETVRIGNNFEQIMDEVKSKKIDLLVAAPHDEHKVWHKFSHLTERLGENSTCETLLVRH